MTRLPALAALLLVLIASAPAAEELPYIVSVTGEGEATAPPDMATISTGVITQATTAREALDQNNAAMQNVRAALERQGIAEKDVQTSSVSIRPVHRQIEDGRIGPEIAAYRVENQLQVRARKLASLGELLDALVQAGSNQIADVSFRVDDPQDVLKEARSRAIRDARARAETYAQAAGVAVARVRQINEQSFQPPPQPVRAGRKFQAAAASVPVATGEQQFRVLVNVIYELALPSQRAR